MRRRIRCHASCCAWMRDWVCTPCFRGGRARFREVVLVGCFTEADKEKRKKKVEERSLSPGGVSREPCCRAQCGSPCTIRRQVCAAVSPSLPPSPPPSPPCSEKKKRDGPKVRLSFIVCFAVLRAGRGGAARVAQRHMSVRHVLSCLTKKCAAHLMCFRPLTVSAWRAFALHSAVPFLAFSFPFPLCTKDRSAEAEPEDNAEVSRLRASFVCDGMVLSRGWLPLPEQTAANFAENVFMRLGHRIRF